MSLKKAVVYSVVPWLAAIGILHAWLNLDLFHKAKAAEHSFKVGFLPVT
jgi:hypothetical protein